VKAERIKLSAFSRQLSAKNKHWFFNLRLLKRYALCSAQLLTAES